jgi:hypothetical protein
MRPVDKMSVVPENAKRADVIDRLLTRQIKLVAVTDATDRLAGMADRADLLAVLTAAV